PGNRVHRFEQAREVALRLVWRDVVVHDLTKQLDFPTSAGRHLPDLGQDIALGPHALVPTRVGYDAEAAELVAALDDGDVGLDRIAAAGDAQRKRHVLVRVEVERAAGAPLVARIEDLLDEHRQPTDGLSADNDVGDAGRAPEDRLALLLRDAAGDGHNRVVAVHRRQLT